MRSILFVLMMALAAAASAVDWKPLPSSAEYRAMVDLDSVSAQQGFTKFMVHRAYAAPQSHPSGKDYSSTRLQYVANCSAGKAALAVTAYYGADRKLIQADIRPKWRSQLAEPEAGSDVAEAVKLACERIAKGGASGPGPSAAAKPPAGSASGSGIVVSRDGYILTNQHVVRQCTTYEVIDGADRKLTAALQAVDPVKDLALLSVRGEFPSVASVRKDASPRLGEAITVVGYPLVNVLGARPSVGFGHVTSTVGVKGNLAQMQISVPVQRGSSGGPVLDEAGNVIGVVVAKLDALKIAQRMGDLPQNVNFAIRGEVVRSFLESQNVKFTASDASAKLENTDIAARGAAVTVRVRCIREAPAPATAPSTPTRSQP